jgi:hypothetical protein
MHGSVVLKSGGTPGIESPRNAKAWLRARSPAALARAKLARDEVHLWRVELDATSPQFAQDVRLILSTDERAQTDGLYLEQNRRRTFILVRGVLWTLSGRYLDLDPGRLRFCYGPHGKLASTCTQKESTSKSHTRAISSFWPSRHPDPLGCCHPDFGTGRLPASRHALDTITRDGLHA